jgi:hypothetical protein
VTPQNFGQTIINSLKILKNAENTPFDIPKMICSKGKNYIKKLCHKSKINLVVVQPPLCQNWQSSATWNNDNYFFGPI